MLITFSLYVLITLYNVSSLGNVLGSNIRPWRIGFKLSSSPFASSRGSKCSLPVRTNIQYDYWRTRRQDSQRAFDVFYKCLHTICMPSSSKKFAEYTHFSDIPERMTAHFPHCRLRCSLSELNQPLVFGYAFQRLLCPFAKRSLDNQSGPNASVIRRAEYYRDSVG